MRKLWKSRTLGKNLVLLSVMVGIALTVSVPVQAFGFAGDSVVASLVSSGHSPIAKYDALSDMDGIVGEHGNGFPSVRASVVLRTEADTIYVGTESAGLFRSTDGGASWVSLTNKMSVPMSNLTVTALAWGDSTNIVYAAVGYWMGTSEAHFAPLGVYASEDGGMSWQAMTGGIPQDLIVAIGIDAEHPSVVHATTESNEDIRYVL